MISNLLTSPPVLRLAERIFNLKKYSYQEILTLMEWFEKLFLSSSATLGELLDLSRPLFCMKNKGWKLPLASGW